MKLITLKDRYLLKTKTLFVNRESDVISLEVIVRLKRETAPVPGQDRAITGRAIFGIVIEAADHGKALYDSYKDSLQEDWTQPLYNSLVTYWSAVEGRKEYFKNPNDPSYFEETYADEANGDYTIVKTQKTLSWVVDSDTFSTMDSQELIRKDLLPFHELVPVIEYLYDKGFTKNDIVIQDL